MRRRGTEEVVMARKVIECRVLIPSTKCTMLFVGEKDDVVKAFTDHVADAHQYAELVGTVEDALQNAVFVGASSAYVGDEATEDGSGGITVPGPGFIIQRFGPVGSTDIPGTTITCQCTGTGTGDCLLTSDGTTASCLNLTCTTCRFQTTTVGIIEDPTLLEADWLFEKDESV
jgi:hypothetical protein